MDEMADYLNWLFLFGFRFAISLRSGERDDHHCQQHGWHRLGDTDKTMHEHAAPMSTMIERQHHARPLSKPNPAGEHGGHD